MKAVDRLDEILKILNRNGRIQVKELSELFEVSEDLIRKDLKKLDEKDQIIRIYGGAKLKVKSFDTASLKHRLHHNIEDKEAIAKKAVDFINSNETIFLDTSSTSLAIANGLARTNKMVTVITNMPEIIRVLEENDGMSLIGIGGVYSKKFGGYVGQSAIQQISNYSVDKAFISCAAVNPETNALSSGVFDVGSTKKTILDSATCKIVAVERRKFGYNCTFKFYSLDDVDYVITEKKLSKVYASILNKKDIKII